MTNRTRLVNAKLKIITLNFFIVMKFACYEICLFTFQEEQTKYDGQKPFQRYSEKENKISCKKSMIVIYL